GFAVLALVAIEEIGGGFDPIPQFPAQERADRTLQRLTGGIQKRHLDAGACHSRYGRFIADAEDAKAVMKNSGLKRIEPEHVRPSGSDSMLDGIPAVCFTDP